MPSYFGTIPGCYWGFQTGVVSAQEWEAYLAHFEVVSRSRFKGCLLLVTNRMQAPQSSQIKGLVDFVESHRKELVGICGGAYVMDSPFPWAANQQMNKGAPKWFPEELFMPDIRREKRTMSVCLEEAIAWVQERVSSAHGFLISRDRLLDAMRAAVPEKHWID